MDFASLGFKVDSRELKKGKADLATFGQQGAKTSKDIQTATQKMQSGFSGVKAALLGLGGGLSALYLLRKAWDTMLLAADFEERRESLAGLGAQFGVSANQIIDGATRAARGLVSISEAADLASSAMARGFSPEQVNQLIRIGDILSDVYSGTTIQGFIDTISTAAATGRTMALGHYKIMVDLDAEYKKFGENLTAAQKLQIRQNAVLAAAEAEVKKFGEPIDSTADKMMRLTKTVANLQLYLGQGLIRAVAGATGAIYSIASAQLTFLAGYLKLEQAYFRVRSALSFGKESDMWKMFSMESRNDAQAAMNAAKDLHYQARDSFDAMTASAEDLASAMKQSYVPAVNEAAGATDEMNKKVAEGKAIYSATRTPIEAYIITMEKLNELLKAGAIDQDTYGRASKQALDEMNNAVEKTKDGFEELQQAIEGWGKDSAEAIVDFAMTGKSSFSDMIQSMIKDLAKMILYQQIMKPLAGAISSGSSGWLSLLVGFAGSLFGGGGSTSIPAGVGLWHKGGLVGYDNPQTRFVNPALFAGAPRLHKGLAPDEYPAILQRGETVTPKGGSTAPTINIINNAGAEISTDMQEVNGGMQIDVMIDQVVARKMGTFGSSSNKVLRSNFSAKERLVGR